MTHFKYRYIHICENKNKGDELDFFFKDYLCNLEYNYFSNLTQFRNGYSINYNRSVFDASRKKINIKSCFFAQVKSTG